MKKGTKRLHIVLSVVIGWLFSLIPVILTHIEERMLIMTPMYIAIYWIFVGLAIWIKKGYQEDK